MDAVLFLLLLVALLGLVAAVYTRLARAALQVQDAIHQHRKENPQP